MIVTLCAPLLFAVGARAEEGGSRSSPSSLAAFDELYARLAAESAGDGLPADAATAAAEELRFNLKSNLIRSDAEIEVLKLEAARFSGARQEDALNRLVLAAVAGERRVWLAIRQLERLAGGAVAAEPAAEPVGDEAESEGGLGLSFKPKDVTEDPDP
jgi:hypothetical protein